MASCYLDVIQNVLSKDKADFGETENEQLTDSLPSCDSTDDTFVWLLSR